MAKASDFNSRRSQLTETSSESRQAPSPVRRTRRERGAGAISPLLRRGRNGFWRKVVIYATVTVLFIQPGLFDRLLAAEHNVRQRNLAEQRYARAVRTYIDPALPPQQQQRLLCRKQLKSCMRALECIKTERDWQKWGEDIEVLREKLHVIHLNLMTELARMRAELVSKGVSESVSARYDEFCEAVQQRYSRFDHRLDKVLRSRGRRGHEVEAGLEEVVEFLRPRSTERVHGDSAEGPKKVLPRRTVVFDNCRPNRPPFFQWPWLLAAGGEGQEWCRLVSDMLDVAPTQGPPDSNDLACSSPEVNFDANNPADPIVAQAAALDYNPVKIFELVRNELIYEPYFGSVKGAERTLVEGGGNDIDLASLLIALLRASNVPCRYVCGTIELSVEEAAAWVGVTEPKNIVGLFQKNGICLDVTYAGGEPAAIVMDHVWASAYIDNFPYRGSHRQDDYEGYEDGDAWIDLDASFKQHEFTAAEDIEQSIGIDFDPETLLSNALFDAELSDDANEKYVFAIDTDLIAEQLLLMGEPVRNYLAARNLTTETVFRQRRVLQERYGLLPVTDQYDVIDRAVRFSTLPEQLRHRLTITLENPDGGVALSVSKSLPELAGKTTTLFYEPADEEIADNLSDPNIISDANCCPAYVVSLRPVLKVGDEPACEQSRAVGPIGMGLIQRLTLTFEGPDGDAEEVVHEVVAGSMHSLVLDLQRITGRDLDNHYGELNAARLRLDANEPMVPDETVGKVLGGIGLTYFHQLDRFNQITAGCLGLAVTRRPSMVRVGWDLDVSEVYGDPNLPFSATSAGVSIALIRDVHTAAAIGSRQEDALTPENQFLFASALCASALEHNALVQALPGEEAAASVAHLIQLANEASSPNNPIYTVTDVNQAEVLTGGGGSLEDLPEFVKQDIKDAVNGGCEVTVPKFTVQIPGISDSNYTGYIKRDIETGASDFIVYDAAMDKATGTQQKNDCISPLELLIDSDSTREHFNGLAAMVNSSATWVKVAEGATTNAGLSYLPAIVDINRWFQNRSELDPVTTVASVLAVIGPITKLSQQVGIFNVHAGAGSGGQITQHNWVGVDANEFIVRADVTHQGQWQAAVYRYGQGSPYFDPCTGAGPDLEGVFAFEESDNGLYRYALTAGADANAAVPVEGAFRVDMTEPNADMTAVNAPDANLFGALVVKGTAWDDYFSRYALSVSQGGVETVVYESTTPLTSESVLGTIGTADFEDGGADIILRVCDLAGNEGTDTYPVTIVRPDRQPPVVDFSAVSDGNEVGSESLVDGVIEVTLAPTDANEQIGRIELWWCDQDLEDCELVAVVEDPNGLPIDVNSGNPLVEQVNPYLFENGPSTVVAYTWDIFGNQDTNAIDFFNNSAISAFQVTPALVTYPQKTLRVTGALTESADWQLTIYDACNGSLAVRDGNETYINEQFTVTDWNDGAYTAELVVGAVDVNTAFVIAFGECVAEISNLYDGWELEETERPPLPVVDKGLFELMGAAYHPAQSLEEVEYKIQLFKPQVTDYDSKYWDDPAYLLWHDYFVKCITPGEPNGDGWSKICRPPYGSLGTLDFTGIKNGAYRMLMSVRYGGSTADANVGFVLDCPLRIGNVKFTQEDLVVDAGGVPLRVTRTYDSFDRKTSGDFGFGWSYSIANMDIELAEDREEMPLVYGEGDASVRFSSNYDRNVTLTLPDGTRTTFLFYLEPEPDSTGVFEYYKAKFASPPGVAATLRTLWPEKMDPYSYWNSMWGGTGAVAYPQCRDFPGYVLTTEDGTEYYIKRKALTDGYTVFNCSGDMIYAEPYGKPYLAYIRTPGGEKIELTVDTSDEDNPLVTELVGKDAQGQTTKQIRIDRDVSNRITAIWAPGQDEQAGDPCTLYYGYDGQGNLTEVHRLTDESAAKYETTRYFYDDDVFDPCDHYVTDINDPRGLTPIKYIYDANGVLTGIEDAQGNTISLSHDINGRTETVYDRYDRATTYLYNERGNIEAVINVLGEVTTYEYDDLGYGRPGDHYYVPGNPDKPTAVTAAGNTTFYEYDREGRTIKITDPEGGVSRYEYDDNGNITLSVELAPDPEDDEVLVELSRTVSEYDDKDRLTSTTDALGHVSKYTYDDASNNLLQTSTQVTDANTGELVNVVTTYTYGDANAPHSPNSITDSAGFTRYFAYDLMGNQIKSWYYWVDANNANNSCTVTNITEYDALGRAVKTVRKVTDANGSVSNSTVTLSKTEYDAIGKADIVVDEHGVVTKYEYDKLGSLVETRVYEDEDTYNSDMNDPDPNNWLTVSRTVYDRQGRAIVTTEPHKPGPGPINGVETVYDPLGRVIETRRWADVNIGLNDIIVDGNIIGKTNIYDGNNNPVWGREGLLSITRTEYDRAGRVEKTKPGMNMTAQAGRRRLPTRWGIAPSTSMWAGGVCLCVMRGGMRRGSNTMRWAGHATRSTTMARGRGPITMSWADVLPRRTRRDGRGISITMRQGG